MMRERMRLLKMYVRYDWPLHFILWITNWLPDNVVFIRFRGWLARPFFGACGKNLLLARSLTFHNPKNIKMGESVFIAFGCLLMANDVVEIENEVMFGPYAVVVSGNHTRLHGSFRYGPISLAPICIGKGSWVGAHSVITAGSNIGQGSLVAAGAVVAGNVPPNVMVGGVPAKVIKHLAD